MGVEGMTISPGYSYDKAPTRIIFWAADASAGCSAPSSRIASQAGSSTCRRCSLSSSWASATTSALPGASPAFSVFGWRKPATIQEGYADSYQGAHRELAWENYGAGSGNPKCANCMVSCGYEWTAVVDGFSSSRGSGPWRAATFSKYPDAHALKMLDEPMPHGPLVQIVSPQSLLPLRAKPT